MVDHSTPEIEELIGAYALDAVDDDERAVVEQHLAVCARCRAELIEHREVAALLAYDGNPAPADLWDRIAESLDEPPPALRLEVARQPEVASLDERRRSKFQRGMYIALAGVAAALALVLGVVIARDDSSTAPSTELAQVAEEANRATGLAKTRSEEIAAAAEQQSAACEESLQTVGQQTQALRQSEQAAETLAELAETLRSSTDIA